MDGWIPGHGREVTGMICNRIETVNTWQNSAEGKGHWNWRVRPKPSRLSRAVATAMSSASERP